MDYQLLVFGPNLNSHTQSVDGREGGGGGVGWAYKNLNPWMFS